MCFRPPSVNKPIKCPACAALNAPIAKICVKCKTDLSTVSSEKPETKD